MDKNEPNILHITCVQGVQKCYCQNIILLTHLRHPLASSPSLYCQLIENSRVSRKMCNFVQTTFTKNKRLMLSVFL